MIECPACRQRLEAGERSCPRCGAVAARRRSRAGFWVIAAVLAFAVLSGGALVVWVKKTTAARNAASLRAYPIETPAARR